MANPGLQPRKKALAGCEWRITIELVDADDNQLFETLPLRITDAQAAGKGHPTNLGNLVAARVEEVAAKVKPPKAKREVVEKTMHA